MKIEINKKYTFEEFVVGPNSRFTHAASMAVAENPGKVYNPLFIYGGVGLGKTHLMQAIGNYVAEKNSQLKILYITSEKFVGEVIDSIAKGKIQQLRDIYREIDLLLVDDIQFLSESESTQDEFFHTFNILHQNSKQIVLTSDRPPKFLNTLEDRLRSRFEWGLIADIKSPTLETRVAILKKKGEHEHLNLDDNILLYIASKLKSNIRELEGFLKRINAYAAINEKPVDIELVKEIMKDLLPEEVAQVQVEKPPEEAKISQKHLLLSDYDSFRQIVTQQEKAKAPAEPKIYVAPSQPNQPQFQQPVISQEVVTSFESPIISKVPIEIDTSLKPVEVAFFYPEGKENDLIKIKGKFKEVIKKHNLKFRLEGIFNRSYNCHIEKLNYAMFIELCKTNKIGIMIVLGPSGDALITNEDFYNTLSVLSENEHISFQYIPSNDINKDYRYLNLSLDITLAKYKNLIQSQ